MCVECAYISKFSKFHGIRARGREEKGDAECEPKLPSEHQNRHGRLPSRLQLPWKQSVDGPGICMCIGPGPAPVGFRVWKGAGWAGLGFGRAQEHPAPRAANGDPAGGLEPRRPGMGPGMDASRMWAPPARCIERAGCAPRPCQLRGGARVPVEGMWKAGLLLVPMAGRVVHSNSVNGGPARYRTGASCNLGQLQPGPTHLYWAVRSCLG